MEMYMNNKHVFGIDLGTNNLKIYSRLGEKIYIEKNIIAIKNKDILFAYGDSAYDMFEKAPANIKISFPLINGVIADIHNMRILLASFIQMITKGNMKPAEYYISIPTDITEVEKRAFYDLIKDSNIKAKKIYLIDKAIANGIGLDIDVKNSQGVLIVDVGYNTTEISILSLGGIVLSKLIKTGGQKFDESICGVIRRQFNILIGNRTAENLKILLSSTPTMNETEVVYGRDLVTGLPIEKEINTDVVNEALEFNYNVIIDNIKVILERTPPELAADIYRRGVYLTGGASQTTNLADLISKGTGLKVNTTENPIETVAIGLAKAIKDPHYKSILYTNDKR